LLRLKYLIHVVGPCQYGMVPRAGGGTTFNMDGSCKNVE